MRYRNDDELIWLTRPQAELVARASPRHRAGRCRDRTHRSAEPAAQLRDLPALRESAPRRAIGAIGSCGTLCGVPFLMKDLVQMTAGEPFQLGWKASRTPNARLRRPTSRRSSPPPVDHAGADDGPEWGAILSTETRAWGQTRNLWDPTRVAGGSSGGAAVAVASGMVPTAHANDAGGSIQFPPPSAGWSGEGVMWSHFRPAHAGSARALRRALARTVRDAAAALDARAGYARRPVDGAPPAVLSGMRLAAARKVESVSDRAASSGAPPALRASGGSCGSSAESLGHDVEASYRQRPMTPGSTRFSARSSRRRGDASRGGERMPGRAVSADDLNS